MALDPHGQTEALLDIGDVLALLVHQEIGDANRHLHQNLTAFAARALFLDLAQDLQAKAVIRTQQAGAMAMGARLRGCLQHARAQTLTRHLQQAKARNAAHLDAGPVVLELVLEALFHGRVVLALFHVDEIDHDQTGKIPQTQLARDFLSGLKVCLEGRFLD